MPNHLIALEYWVWALKKALSDESRAFGLALFPWKGRVPRQTGLRKTLKEIKRSVRKCPGATGVREREERKAKKKRQDRRKDMHKQRLV